MGLHETKKLLYNKGIGHQTKEAAFRMGEKSLPSIHLTRINNQNIQGVQNTNLSINHPQNKWADELNRQVSKEV
jgi:hypothetical protein